MSASTVVCLDLEGVLVPEIWIEVSRRTGIAALARTTRDEPDYDRLMQGRLKILAERRLRLADLQSVIAGMGPLPGAGEFLDGLRRRHQVVILSDTFYEFADPLMAQLGRPTLFCHRLETDGEGFVSAYRLRLPDQKRRAVEAFRALNFRTIAAGDSFNDTSMLAAAHAGIFFCPPEEIAGRFPQFPVTRDYAALGAAIEAAAPGAAGRRVAARMATVNAPASENRWLSLVASMPAEDPAARMRVLRTLESLGAAMMREGVYLLPDSPGTRRGLESLADYILRNGGGAWVLQVSAADGGQERAFQRLFDRTARYDQLVKVIESLKVGYGVTDPSALSRVLHKQRRDLEAIAALDFFPSEARSRAEAALAAAEEQVRQLMFPSQAQGAAAAGGRDLLVRRSWATRRPAWADRLACAWLIRRFVDPEGRITWLDKAQEPPAGAVGFAFDGARFGNSASQVTFEVMLERFGLAGNAALAKIGTIVRFLEVRDTPVPEAAGVQTLLQGAARRAAGDDELLAEAEKTFDLLYEAYFEAPRR